MTTRTPAGTVLFAATERTPFTVFVAEDPHDVERAQALRYDAFSTEMGAPLPGAVFSERLGRPIDVDRFDDYSAHLLVRHDPTDEIVGCYRIILPAPSGQREVFTTSMFRLSPAFAAMADDVAEWGVRRSPQAIAAAWCRCSCGSRFSPSTSDRASGTRWVACRSGWRTACIRAPPWSVPRSASSPTTTPSPTGRCAPTPSGPSPSTGS